MSNAISKTSLLQPKTMQEAMEFSEMLAKSSMVPPAFKNKAGDILVAVQWGYEVGLPPMSALQNIAVINGKPSIYGDAALALITSHQEYAGHREWIDGETAHCLISRKVGGAIVETERTFSMTQAKRARLAGKQGPWSQYPERMLQMRARGYAMRDAFPDALKGVITAEEARDHDMQDITPTSSALDEAFPAIEQQDPPAAHPAGDIIDDDADTGVVADPVATPDEIVFVLPDLFNVDDRDQDRVFAHDEASEWCLMFTNNAAGFVNEPTLDTVERRHALSILKKCNADGLSHIEEVDPEQHKSLKDRYNKAIRRLSAEAKKEGAS